VINGDLNPIWNESFHFLVEDAVQDMVMAQVWDKDTFGKVINVSLHFPDSTLSYYLITTHLWRSHGVINVGKRVLVPWEADLIWVLIFNQNPIIECCVLRCGSKIGHKEVHMFSKDWITCSYFGYKNRQHIYMSGKID
jgi:hypothetical protein